MNRVRTFKAKSKKSYRNPIALALEWRKALDRGEYSSQAGLARKKGISRARVTQVLNLLRLSPKAIRIVISLGDPLPACMVTERQLRPLINLSAQNQLNEIMNVLGVTRGGEELTRRS